jgi:polyisoprenoid-binding protein YceI
MSPIRFILAFLTLAAVLPAAGAVEFGQVLPDKQMGVPVDGRFRKFGAVVAFDPAKPAQGSARIDIDLNSVDTGSPEADAEVVGKPWFNVKAFPTASFVSTGVKPLGGDRYEVAGKLTIKGRTQDIVAPATFRTEAGNGVFAGGFTLKRLDFALGEGVWSDIATVANEVQVRFHIVAAPRK